MFTDIVGYTKLTQANEASALELLDAHQKLIRPILAKFGGQEVKTIGDAFLVEFGSALQATESAIEMQKVLHEYNESNQNKILIRIGIHVGDVVHRDGDVYGDAVNIASRIEPQAEGGGVCISEQVYDQVKNKLSLPMVQLESVELKNIKDSIDVFRIVLPWNGEQSMAETGHDRRRIAVLPFANFSSDPNDEYFADGITEEIISTVSNIGELSVISRTSVMGYKGTAKKVREIGRELNVGSILEGSFRKAGNRIRITTQLIEVTNDRHVWSQSYDRELDDVFAVQSDIAKQVASALRVKILPNEVKQIEKAPTNSTEAHVLYLKGTHYWNERSKDGLLKAIDYFEHAIEKDQGYALAYSGIADCYSVLSDHGYLPKTEAIPKAQSNAEKAIQLDDELSEAHASLGLATQGTDLEKSRRELRRAIELNPNNAYAHMWYGLIAEQKHEKISECEKAVELDPLNLQINSSLGAEYYTALRLDESIAQLKKTEELGPEFPPVHMWLGLAYSMKGEHDEAVREAREAIKLRSGARILMGAVLARAGLVDEAREIAHEFDTSKEYVDPADMAWLYAAIGYRKLAIDRLSKAVEENSAHLTYLANDPSMSDFRQDPEVKALLERARVRHWI
jgi:adenylate cyclase